MKRFAHENIAPATRALALAVTEASLAVTRLVRAEVRARPPAGLTLTQVRALGAIGRQPGASLSELAEQLGIGLPTTSKLVEDLVGRRLVRRAAEPRDRRRLALQLTPAGNETLSAARELAATRVATLLAPLSGTQKARLGAAAASLLEILAADTHSRPLARPARGGAATARRPGRQR